MCVFAYRMNIFARMSRCVCVCVMGKFGGGIFDAAAADEVEREE